MSLIQIDNLTAVNYGETGEGGILVTQYSMIDTDVAKVDANDKADAYNASDGSDSSNVDTPKINVRRVIGNHTLL